MGDTVVKVVLSNKYLFKDVLAFLIDTNKLKNKAIISACNQFLALESYDDAYILLNAYLKADFSRYRVTCNDVHKPGGTNYGIQMSLKPNKIKHYKSIW